MNKADHPFTCAVLNRNYPPGAGITGQSAYELAVFLDRHGICSFAVSVTGRYPGGGSLEIAQNPEHTVVRVPSVYNGKHKLGRLIASLIEGQRMTHTVRNMRPHILIGLTDPPLLNCWIARTAGQLRIPWIYWAMDLYPDAFAAAGLITPANLGFKFLRSCLQRHPPCHIIALGPRQAAYIQTGYPTPIPMTILPCGIGSFSRSPKPPPWHPGPDKLVFGYGGNIGEAHDYTFVESVMRNLDPNQHLFVLAVYGKHASRLIALGQSLPAVRVINRIKPDELGWVDVHLVTLRPEWDHICVPSKAVSAVCAGSALLLACSERNDNWTMLGDAAWRIDPSQEKDCSVLPLLRIITRDAIIQKRQEAARLAEMLRQTQTDAYAGLLDVIRPLEN